MNVARPFETTRAVNPGMPIRASDQNRARAALLALQALQNQLRTANVRPWAEAMLHEIKVIQDDYLECVRVWGPTPSERGTETVYVAKPGLLRQSLTSRDGVTYVYTTSQQRTASKAGFDDETQVVTQSYLVGDIIEATRARALTGIAAVDGQRAQLVDANVDGRAWAAIPP